MAQMLLCSNIPLILSIPPFRAEFKIVLFSNPSIFSLQLLSSERSSSLSACQQPCGGWQRKLVCIHIVTHATTSRNLLLCSPLHHDIKEMSTHRFINYKQALLISSVISYFIPATCQAAKVSCRQGWPPVTPVQLNATVANDRIRGLCRAWLLYLGL